MISLNAQFSNRYYDYYRRHFNSFHFETVYLFETNMQEKSFLFFFFGMICAGKVIVFPQKKNKKKKNIKISETFFDLPIWISWNEWYICSVNGPSSKMCAMKTKYKRAKKKKRSKNQQSFGYDSINCQFQQKKKEKQKWITEKRRKKETNSREKVFQE